MSRLGGRLVTDEDLRGTCTGDDGRLPELRQRYGDHWIPALLTLIRASA